MGFIRERYEKVAIIDFIVDIDFHRQSMNHFEYHHLLYLNCPEVATVFSRCLIITFTGAVAINRDVFI